mgnify:CR=1 FL=1
MKFCPKCNSFCESDLTNKQAVCVRCGHIVELEPPKKITNNKVVDEKVVVVFEKLPKKENPVMIDKQMIVVIKSAVYSPTLKKNIALANIAKDYCEFGTKLEVLINKEKFSAEVVNLPFYIRN